MAINRNNEKNTMKEELLDIIYTIYISVLYFKLIALEWAKTS